MEKKPKFISLKEAQKKYGTNGINILNWAKSGKITCSRIAGSWFVDAHSIDNYLLANARYAFLDDTYLEEEIKIRREEIDEVLEKYDDYIFFLRSFHKVHPVFRLFLKEIALYIPKEKNRKIFIDVSMGKSIRVVAEEHNTTYVKIAQIYREVLDRLSKKYSGFLFNHHEILLSFREKNNKLKLENRYLTEELKQFEEYRKGLGLNFKEMPGDVAKLFSKTFQDVGLDTRMDGVLYSNNIRTIGDCLIFLKHYPIEDFLKLKDCGKASLNHLKEKLKELNIMDDTGHIEYLKYLS